jgi:hypothetical protein
MFQKTIEMLTGKAKKRFKYYAHTKSKIRRKPEGQLAEVNFGGFLLNRDMGRYSFILCQIFKFSGFKRKSPRATRIIFSGNFERTLYSNKVLKDNFGWTISRVDIFDHIKAHYSSDSRIVYAPSQKHFYEMLAMDDSKNKFIIAEVKTNPQDWLKILSSGDFFLCLPDMGMPWAHNAFEAMAVGAIPIIQYNNLFNPPLIDLENCLTYKTFESLNEAIESALNMRAEDVQRMKEQVIKYYEEYISTKQIIKRIQSFHASEDVTLTIAMPYLNEEAQVGR